MSKLVYKPSAEAKKVQAALRKQEVWLEQWTRSLLGNSFVDAHIKSNPLLVQHELSALGLHRKICAYGLIKLMLRDICLDTFPSFVQSFTQHKYEKKYTDPAPDSDDVPF